MLRTRSVVRRSIVVSSLVVGGLAGPAPVHAAPKDWTLPPDAKALGDDVYEIYSHEEADGRVRFCWAIVSRQHGAEAKAAAGGSRGGSGGAPYTYLAAGMKWKGAPEGYYVDASGAVGHTDGTLSDQNVHDGIRDAIAQWEDATNGVLGDGVSLDVMGDELGTSVDAASIGVAANGRNEICFGPIATAGSSRSPTSTAPPTVRRAGARSTNPTSCTTTGRGGPARAGPSTWTSRTPRSMSADTRSAWATAAPRTPRRRCSRASPPARRRSAASAPATSRASTTSTDQHRSWDRRSVRNPCTASRSDESCGR
jgi:hypothetical protein